MTEERHKEIENILNNIKYTRKTPPSKGAYFEKYNSNYSVYSSVISIDSYLELNKYLRKKYDDVLNKEIVYILIDGSTNTAIIYNSDMKETKIDMPFDCFWCDNNGPYDVVNYFSFLPSKIFKSLEFCNLDRSLYIVHPDKVTNNIMQITNLMPARDKRYDNLSFEIVSKTLSTTFAFSRSVKTGIFDYEKILSTSDFLKYTEQRKKLEIKKFNTFYHQYTNMFDYYDNLSDEQKLKLKLIGKL